MSMRIFSLRASVGEISGRSQRPALVEGSAPLRYHAVLRSSLTLALLCLSSASCLARATSIEVTLATDAPPDSMLVATVWASGEGLQPVGDAAFVQCLSVDPDAGFAGSFSLVPRPGAARDGRVSIRVEAVVTRAGVSQRLVQWRTTQFTPFVSTQLPVFLSMSCLAARTGCQSVGDAQCTQSVLCEERGLTCDRGGECISRDQRPGELDARASELDASADAAGEPCDGSLQSCSGACVNTATSTAHCGRCGNRCPSLPNAVVACADGACVLQSCVGDWANCDGSPGNGCESLTGQREGLCRCGLRCNSTYVCTNQRRNCCLLSSSCANNNDCSNGRRCMTISGASARHCCY